GAPDSVTRFGPHRRKRTKDDEVQCPLETLCAILPSFKLSSEVSEAILPRLYLIVKWKNPRLGGLRYRVTGCRTRRCLASIGTAVEGFHGESSLQGLT